MIEYLEPLINGILLGGLYGVVGIGLSMVFGIMRQVNLAHGELMILSSYLSLVFLQVLGLHPLVTLILVAPLMFFIGYLIQILLFNRVMQRGMEPFLMISFGLSIIIQNALLLIFTPDARSLETAMVIKGVDVFGLFNIPLIYLVNFTVGALVLTALHQFMKRTYMGWAINASADNETAAKLMGINVNKVYAYALGIAAVTAAISGVLVGMSFTFYPHSGTQYLIIAFGVVIIGGLGSLPGTFLGGLVLGVSQLFGGRILGPGFQLLSGYIILLIILTVRPQGILGGR
ncbi:MAG: branched-chain amino acid ABC transporter permease [Desulfobacteraceae bacterium]|uniref:Branched-chain amino acid ABC transporter permease n=1 Tax=Candidatus Desulfacyla euxinica TaxID=2841693 RepID=A0A8J6T7S9_9DELT|nr:branched-chain amino acid ABC transporter permease [Candidatus Desulfacyla euxinica]MBL6979033.1 branched-chain amino acid ABC transporter permease [Desulfobacteraceae bacterium]